MPVSKQFFQLLSPQDRGALKLTIQQFYRVNGDSTQNRGVASDVVLPSLLDKMELGESFLDNALAFDRIPAAQYTNLHMVNADIISNLRKASEHRVANDTEFKDVAGDIKRYVERKARKVVSLNEADLRKEREESKRETAEQKKLEEDANGEDAPIFPKNYYNDEVLRISVDYLDMLKGMKTAKK
jgi:carboxyl-terminal processing protease